AGPVTYRPQNGFTETHLRSILGVPSKYALGTQAVIAERNFPFNTHSFNDRYEHIELSNTDDKKRLTIRMALGITKTLRNYRELQRGRAWTKKQGDVYMLRSNSGWGYDSCSSLSLGSKMVCC